MAEILQYVHKDGFFHRLHPFTKILFIIVASIICILVTSIPILVLMVAALLVLAFIGDLHREVIQQLKLVLVMSVVFVIITVITMPGGETIGHVIPQGVSGDRRGHSHHDRCDQRRPDPGAPVHGADLRSSSCF